MNGNPIRDRVDLGSKCIPLGFHGDEVPITGQVISVGANLCSLLHGAPYLVLVQPVTECFGCGGLLIK